MSEIDELAVVFLTRGGWPLPLKLLLRLIGITWTHAGFWFLTDNVVIEAAALGIRKVPKPDHFPGSKLALGRIPDLTPERVEKLRDFCEGSVGMPYGYLDLILTMITYVSHWIFALLRGPVGIQRLWGRICSGIVQDALAYIGVEIDSKLFVALPDDIYRSLEIIYEGPPL